MPPYSGQAEYRYLVVGLEDVEFQSLVCDIPAEPEVILKAVLHYVMWDDPFYLERLTDEVLPEEELERSAAALDIWFSLHIHSIERVFGPVKQFAPMRVNHATIKGRFVKLELTYEEFISA